MSTTTPRRLVLRFAALLTLLILAVPALAQPFLPRNCSPFSANVRSYYEYLYGTTTEGPALCTGPADTGCLEPTSYLATRSDGRRVNIAGVYRWRADGDTWGDHGSPPRPRLLVHFLMEYLKKLRNAYEVCPHFFTQVFNQIDYIVTDAIEHHGALVWENRLGIAQGMEQADMATMFMSMAGLHDRHGHLREARGTMRYALRSAQAFFKPVGQHSGGVRSGNEEPCAAQTARLRPCFWFHSRGRGIDTQATGEPLVNTVLNQHLHAVRDAIGLSIMARDLAHLIPDDSPPPTIDFRTWLTWADVLEDRAIGGLYQLAFSNGHRAVAPTRPPNLAQFMLRRNSQIFGTGEWFYTARYNFDLLTGQGLDISPENVCHYQGHSLNILAGIWATLQEEGARLTVEDGWRLSEAMERLLEGGGEPVGLLGSTHALYQFYRTEDPHYREDIWQCPAGKERLTKDSYDILEPFFGPWPLGYR